MLGKIKFRIIFDDFIKNIANHKNNFKFKDESQSAISTVFKLI